MPAKVIVATLLRETGETGVQTHFNAFRDYLQADVPVEVVTPFAAPSWAVYPVFGLRRLVDRIDSTASVWWYRYWHYLFLRLALRERLRDGHGVIYAQCPLSARAALEARVSPSQRVVLVTHFNISQAHEFAMKGQIHEGGRYYRAIRAMEARILPQVDGVVYVSEFMRQTLEKEMPPIAKVPAAVIPNFVARPPNGEPNDNRPLRDLISIGTLEPRKNQQYLLRVLAAAAKHGRRYTLTLVGDGPDRSMLENLADELGVAELVDFAGFRPDAASLLAGHRAYVHGALIENLPLTLVEALARGLPVFAAAVGGIPEVFTEGVEGSFWPLDDADAGAQRLMEILDDPARYACCVKAAQARFEERFEAGAVGERLLRFVSGAGS